MKQIVDLKQAIALEEAGIFIDSEKVINDNDCHMDIYEDEHDCDSAFRAPTIGELIEWIAVNTECSQSTFTTLNYIANMVDYHDLDEMDFIDALVFIVLEMHKDKK